MKIKNSFAKRLGHLVTGTFGIVVKDVLKNN